MPAQTVYPVTKGFVSRKRTSALPDPLMTYGWLTTLIHFPVIFSRHAVGIKEGEDFAHAVFDHVHPAVRLVVVKG